MKTSLSSFDLRTLVAEWQDLVGGHLDKAYQREDEVILRINAPAGGKAELFYKAGRWLCLHEVENKPESPPPFAQTLRRLLANARITNIEQSGFDRIAMFHLEHGGGTVDLIFEAFGKGNVAVVRDDVTVAAMFPQTLKDRSVQVGEPYAVPRAAIDATPIELIQYRDLERREFPIFNGALSHYLTVAEPETATAENVAAKFERRIAQQRESLDALREEAMRLEAQAVFLYGHYQVFDELLKAIREGRPPPEHAQIKAIDRKEHTVTLAIGDFDAITLDYEKDVTANAQALYDRRKAALAKAQRVEEAIAATTAEMEAAQAKAVKVAKRPRIKSTKAMWFEAYRWTISSEEFLILGGRDARTNDQLVKKHLKEGDRYAHADIHGAPSTVIKDGARASDATLREACEFALAYSKAWSAGLASGSAYWVLPEQVSKQAESGEFLPRGAFVIRGKRNYIHDLPVRIAIGEVEVEGHRKIMGGPVTAVASRSARYVAIAPGKGDRDAISKKLASVFGVPIEEITRAMPPGSVEIVERHGIEA